MDNQCDEPRVEEELHMHPRMCVFKESAKEYVGKRPKWWQGLLVWGTENGGTLR